MHDEIKLQIKKYYDDWFSINKLYHDWARHHNISQKTLFVLYEIYHTDSPCTQVSICEKTSYQKQTVSQIVNSLEKDGLLYRTKNPRDLRNKILHLTMEGTTYTRSLLSELENLEIQAFETMDATDRKKVIKGLHILSKSLEKSFEK